jgi:hypothetical protein
VHFAWISKLAAKRFLAMAAALSFSCCSGSDSAAPTAKLAAASSSTCSLAFSGDVPLDVSIGSQDDANCFAWQEMVALNWIDSSLGGFGDPSDLTPVAWQSYMSNHRLFQPGGAPPPAWDSAPVIEPSCLLEAGLSGKAARAVTPMTMTTSFDSEFENGDSQQAAPRDGPAWLADTNGNNIWYEVRVDRNEYDMIVKNQLYSREGQTKWYSNQGQNPKALALPVNDYTTTPQTVGAMELKAAWMEVPDSTDRKWNSYKLTPAIVVDPVTQKCKALTVALVGFHIIHKTQSQSTWIWATFEHVDNAPNDSAARTTTKIWNFYNPSCKSVTINVPAACQFKNQSTVTVGCAPNQSPQYAIGPNCPAPTPVQVTRLTPIDSAAQATNQAAWAAIKKAYPKSVWQNYQLVSVLWSSNTASSQPASVPQKFNSPQPNAPLANTTLETYAQQKKCVDCHQFATISGSHSLPSDFSFALQEAQSTNRQFTDLPQTKSKAAHPAKRRIVH